MVRSPLRVAIVSPQPLVRLGLAGLLRDGVDRVSVVDVAEHDGALDAHEAVVYDLTTEGDPTRRRDLRLLLATAPVVALTHRPTPELEQKARSVGVSALVPLSIRGHELVDVLERVVALRARQQPERRTSQRELLRAQHRLSARELDILELIVAGRSNQAIATELFLTVNTVKTYVRTAYRKIGARDRTQAVLWCVAHGVLADAPLAHGFTVGDGDAPAGVS